MKAGFYGANKTNHFPVFFPVSFPPPYRGRGNRGNIPQLPVLGCFGNRGNLLEQDKNKMENKKRGKWKTGESGNPKGRPPGSGEIAQLRNSIAAHIPEIIEKLVFQAKSGDTQAARLLLERVCPPLKPMEQAIALLPAGKSLTAQGVAIVEAVAAGILAPGQAAGLLAGLGTLARIKELDELERRITQLEEESNGNA